MAELLVEVLVMMMVIMVPVEVRGKLCLPGLNPFLQTYISHYYFREIHVIFNGTGKRRI